MSSYTVYTKHQTHRLTKRAGIVISCTIDFLEGLPFDMAHTLLKQKGWTIVPDIDAPTNVFEFAGDTFTLKWKGNNVISILKNDEEISWDELPEQLKGLL